MWWNGIHLEQLNDGQFHPSTSHTVFNIVALRDRKEAFSGSWEGACIDPAAIVKAVNTLNIPGMVMTRMTRCSNNSMDYWMTWPEGNLVIESEGMGTTTDYTVSCVSFNAKHLDEIEKIAKTCLAKVEKGSVYALVNTESGIEISRIGIGGRVLLRSNYMADVLKGFDVIVKSMTDPKPFGRLVILEGPAGTGKSHFVKGLLDAVSEVAFIIIQAETVKELAGPQLLGALLDRHKENRPMVLIIEDADDILVERRDGDMSSISSLLNLSDGPWAAFLDLRIICTTNAAKQSFDSAVTRKGRLLRHIKVAELDHDTALNCLIGILGTDTDALEEARLKIPVKGMTLAEVYSLAQKDADQGSVPKPARPMGFGS